MRLSPCATAKLNSTRHTVGSSSDAFTPTSPKLSMISCALVFQLHHHLRADRRAHLRGVLAAHEARTQRRAQRGDHVVHDPHRRQLAPGLVRRPAGGRARRDAAHDAHLAAHTLQRRHAAGDQGIHLRVVVARAQARKAREHRAVHRHGRVALPRDDRGGGRRHTHIAGRREHHALAVELARALHELRRRLARAARNHADALFLRARRLLHARAQLELHVHARAVAHDHIDRLLLQRGKGRLIAGRRRRGHLHRLDHRCAVAVERRKQRRHADRALRVLAEGAHALGVRGQRHHLIGRARRTHRRRAEDPRGLFSADHARGVVGRIHARVLMYHRVAHLLHHTFQNKIRQHRALLVCRRHEVGRAARGAPPHEHTVLLVPLRFLPAQLIERQPVGKAVQ